MQINAQTILDGDNLETDVCIVGAGPAGLTLAHELAGENFRVALIESGGQTADPSAQDLAASEGDLMAAPYPNLYWMRSRQLGGTANQWLIDMDEQGIGVRYVPFDDLDFEPKDWMPNSGWPFAKAELDPYYVRAQKVCQIGPYAYDAEAWQSEAAPQFSFASGNVTTRMFQCGPRDVFLKDIPQKLAQATNITTYFNATVVKLETDALANHVTCLQIATLGGGRFSLKSRFVILAQGGFEAARLLLLSGDVQPQGLGNEHDLVGRYLMDHQLVRGGLLRPGNPKVFNKMALYDLRQRQGIPVIGKFILSEDVMRREQLLNVATALFPRHGFFNSSLLRRLLPKGRRHFTPGVPAYQNFVKALKQKQLPDRPLALLKNIITNLDDVLGYKARIVPLYSHPSNDCNLNKGGWSDRSHPEQEFGVFDVVQMVEQAPDPNNRITLGNECDALGCRKLKVNWRWNEIDTQSIFRTQAILRKEFAQAGLGQLELRQDHEWPELIQATIHHNLGTTRMHDNPHKGVVNSQCRVHRVANLFIASSSVFPTGGYANPTLTVVAIAIRVADQVKARLA